MEAWLVWASKLLMALIAFLQANPFPAHRMARLERRAERVAVRRGVTYQLAPQNPATAAVAQSRGQDRPLVRVVASGVMCVRAKCHPYEWRAWSADPRRHYLYIEGQQAGAWCYDRCEYRSYDPKWGWGLPAAQPPVEVPGIENPPADHAARPIEAVGSCVYVGRRADESFIDYPIEQPGPAGIPNFGVDVDKCPKAGAKHMYAINGVPCERKRAFEALAGGKAGLIPDDIDSLRITCIGADAAPTATLIRQDLERSPLLSAWKDKVVIQDYLTADVPILKGLGFVNGIQVQAPDGKPLWYAAQYDGDKQFADGLQLADARKKDPAWDPMKWPDLAKPPLAVTPATPADPATPAGKPTKGSVEWWWMLITLIAGVVLKYLHANAPIAVTFKRQPPPPPAVA